MACLHGTVTSPIHRQTALWIDAFASGTWAEDTDHVLLGEEIEAMGDDQLADAVKRTTLFARVSPTHKQLIIEALQARDHAVGFQGDGINDAAALRAADVGISVDTAVDITKASADRPRRSGAGRKATSLGRGSTRSLHPLHGAYRQTVSTASKSSCRARARRESVPSS